MTGISCSTGSFRLGIVAALLLISLLAKPPSLHAAAYDLSGGAGAVTLTQNGTTVDVTVHLNSPNNFVKTGAADFMAFEFNATGVVLEDISVNQTVAGETLAASAGPGSFGFGISCGTCHNGATGGFSNDIVFHVANTVIADLTAANSSNIVFVAGLQGGPSTVAGTAGDPAPDPVTQLIVATPEPVSILLLGFGFAGLGVARRRLQRRT